MTKICHGYSISARVLIDAELKAHAFPWCLVGVFKLRHDLKLSALQNAKNSDGPTNSQRIA